MEEIYKLKFGQVWEQEMKWGIRYNVLRVPGGWIFTPIDRKINGNDSWLQPTFVPYSNEYTTREEDTF